MSFEYLNRPAAGEACPFCLAGDAVVLFEVGAEEAVAHFLPPSTPGGLRGELRFHLVSLWGRETCRVLRCRVCGGCFASPLVAGDEEFYRLAYRFRFGYPRDRWEFHRALDRLCAGGSLAGLRILELGSGDGAFLRLLLERGAAPANLYAVEYSLEGRRRIRALSPAIHVYNELAAALAAAPPLDAAAAFQVLEHLSEPADCLRTLAARLAPAGRVFASTPNPARIEFHERHGGLKDMPPNHVLRFSRGGIAALAARTGLRVEHLEDSPFEFRPAVAAFLKYRYLRRTQEPGTLEHRLDSLSANRTVRKLLAAFVAGLALPSALSACQGRSDGDALFMVLRPGA